MGKGLRIQPEIFFAILLVILGLVVMIVSAGYGLGSLRQPGSGFYPLLLGSLIVTFSVLLLILRRDSRRGESLAIN